MKVESRGALFREGLSEEVVGVWGGMMENRNGACKLQICGWGTGILDCGVEFVLSNDICLSSVFLIIGIFLFL